MKKIIFVFLGVLLFAYSCTKEEDKITENLNDDTGMKKYLSINPIETKIQKFINRIELVREDANYIGSEEWNYSADSTIWYIEAALNYQYAYPTEDHDLTFIDSVNFTIALNANTEAEIAQIVDAYDAIVDSTSIIYNSVSEEEKFLLVENVEGDIGTDNNIVLKIFIVVAYNGLLPNADWKLCDGGLGISSACNSGGLCNSSNYLNYDARDKIIQLHKINYPPSYINGSSTNSSAASIFSINTANIIPCPIPNVYDGNTYWLFYENYSNHPNNVTSCLSASRISYYSDNLEALIVYWENYYGNNYTCIYQDIEYFTTLCCNSHEYDANLDMGLIIDRSDPPQPTFYDKYAQ